ncbi:MAG: hypothetical protein ACO1N9_10700 [Flavobacterium sp.]
MKQLLLLAGLLSITITSAQQATRSNENSSGLTEFEFNIARENYRKMQESPDSKLMMQKVSIHMEMLNGLSVPKEFYMDAEGDIETQRKTYATFLQKNINKTKFRSVEEGVDMMESIMQLSQRITENNKGLYAMIGKASKEQFIKIVDTHYIIRPSRFWYPRFH